MDRRAIWRALSALDPENPEYLRNVAACVSLRAELPQAWERRLPILQEALALAQQPADRFPGVPAYRNEVANRHHAIAGWGFHNRYSKAEAHLDRAREIRERLCEANPSDPELQNELGYLNRVYSEIRCSAGRHADAVPYSRRALAIHEHLHARHPTIP